MFIQNLSKIRIGKILPLILIITLSVSGLMVPDSYGSKSQFSGKISLKMQDVRALFELKEGSDVKLRMTDGKNQTTEVTGTMKSHINPGSESGVLHIRLTGSSGEMKFLINRKKRYDKVVYQATLKVLKTNSWYSGNSDGPDEQITLNQKPKNQIVTDWLLPWKSYFLLLFSFCWA